MPGGLERDAQRVGVLHDAVVHQRHPGVAVAVRVRVALGGDPVRGPARVRDPARAVHRLALQMLGEPLHAPRELDDRHAGAVLDRDRKSTRLNSSHTVISYAVFCLKKKKKTSRAQVQNYTRPSSKPTWMLTVSA